MKNLSLILIMILLAVLVASRLAGCSAPVAPTATPPIGATNTPTAAPTLAPKTLVVAHRGGAALAPENTLAAFENALKLGVDMVECDVHLSKEGELIVMHDFTVSRTTNGTGEIRDLTLAELKQLNAAAKFTGGNFPPQPVPTLAELLDLVKGKAGVQIEIKVGAGNARYPGIEQKVIDLVNARGMTNDVILISFDFPTLKQVKAMDARIHTGALVNAAWMMTRRLAAPEQIVAEAIDTTGAEYFMPPFGTVFEDLVRVVHARGLKIGVWTVNVEADMRRLAGWGVDAITSDKPDELKKALGR